MSGVDSPLLLRMRDFADFMIGCVGPILIFLATVLISGIAFIHFTALVPYYSPEISVVYLLHMVWSVWLLFNIGFNYYKVVTTPPGCTADIPQELYSEDLLVQIRTEDAPQRGTGFSRWCKSCKRVKPPRSHHCHICKQCVLRMDHHCPWVGRCVGMHNHKFFFLFMFYLWLACVWVFPLSLYPLYMADITAWWGDEITIQTSMLLAFGLTLSISAALGGLMFWHLYLIGTNQTTIEFYYNNQMKKIYKGRGQVYQNEYDLGWRKNWQMFFGIESASPIWLAWLIPSTSLPHSWGMDGSSFPLRNGEGDSYAHMNNNVDHLV
ncbi:hypothetical protein PROFUN_10363 [Planoprotostelium fungivorum]|uniref:Palmitoyltransferase n=1 Tax=Planoprotostelium fungivorum TaxID=1890364 RepID=A0A2P6NED4_9EUKA|nr:hypothetical protein PROFUN_10363 [Planoprotostelium fungivorum]